MRAHLIVPAVRWRLAVLGVVLLGLFQGAAGARQTCTPQSITRVGGTTQFGTSGRGSLSETGRFVAFESNAADLDGDSTKDVFVYDRSSCTLELISVSSLGVKGDGPSERPSISDDGRFVAFLSSASNLDPADANGAQTDAYLRDRLLGVTTLISVDSAEVQPPTASATFLRISGNGLVVAFVSAATTLVPGDTNNDHDVFVRDLAAGTTERVSVSSTGQQSDSPFPAAVAEPVLSHDGRFIAFESSMNALVPDDTNFNSDVFVRDRLLSTTVRASLNSSGLQVSGGGTAPSITADGRFVFFSSGANFVPANPACDGIFVRDLVSNSTTCPTLDPLDVIPTQIARRPAVSADGRYVAFSSFGRHYVPGDTAITDLFVHDRVTGATHRANVSAAGLQANLDVQDGAEISADGRIAVFDSNATNLVASDTNIAADVFVAEWGSLPSVAEVDLMRNGSFAAGLQLWQAFATPDQSYVVTDTSTGELQFYREPPPPGTSNQAVVFQQTGARLFAHTPLEARFRLGNSSTARKRLSVLVHDADFSDLAVCTFWLAPGAPMRDYTMRLHTTEFWTNATMAFYAASAGSDGGFYRVDGVSLTHLPTLDDDVTDCIDPTAPVAPGGAPSPTLLANGDFASGLAPWATFGQITWQITNGVFEFIRPPGTPAGVLLQPTGQALAQNDILTGLVYLGNTSTVRKRVTMILHDQDFSDLSACTFWLPPQSPLSPFVMRTFATKAWANATLSVYPATVGPDEWIRFTDATLQITPGTTPLGTECLEPGANSVMVANRGLLAFADRVRVPRASRTPGAVSTFAVDGAVVSIQAVSAGPRVLWQRTLDLGSMSNPVLSFESSFEGTTSSGHAQVSLDGAAWITIAKLPASPDWTTIDLDLSAYGGDIVHVRLVFDVGPVPSGSAPDRWRVRRIRLDGRH